MKVSTLALALALAASFGLTSMAFAQTGSAAPAASSPTASKEKPAHKTVKPHKPEKKKAHKAPAKKPKGKKRR